MRGDSGVAGEGELFVYQSFIRISTQIGCPTLPLARVLYYVIYIILYYIILYYIILYYIILYYSRGSFKLHLEV